MDAIAVSVRMPTQSTRVIDHSDLPLRRQTYDAGIQLVHCPKIPPVLFIDRRNFCQHRTHPRRAGQIHHPAQIAQRHRRIQPQQRVVRAAQDHHLAIVIRGDLARKTLQHLRCRLAADAEVRPRKRPAPRERIAQERHPRARMVETRKRNSQRSEDHQQPCQPSSHAPIPPGLYHHRMIPLEDAQARARNIKVLIFDVDGVLTDGDITIIPQPDGSGVEVKSFTAHDGLAISLARLGGLRTGVITKRQSQTVALRMRDLKMEFVYQGQAHKLKAFQEILAKAEITADQLCYVGDDIVDLPILRLCGLGIATANARSQVKQAAHWVTPLPGGQGAGRDAIEFILAAQGSLDRVIEEYLDADNPAAQASDIGAGNM